MRATYISIDEEKRLLPGYVPERAEEFHAASAKSADKSFMKALKVNRSPIVILLCGGSASGKTEFCSEYLEFLEREDAIVFDSTLPTPLGAKNKLRMIAKAKKRAVVYAVLPDDLHRAFLAFLGRERKFQPEHFYRTHSGSRATLLWIGTEHPEVEIKIFESSYDHQGGLRYRALTFGNRSSLLAYLHTIQYTEEQVAQLTHPL